jgi:hypothetical protein
MLKPMSVAEFYRAIMIALRELGIAVTITTMPCEIADCIPFEQDTLHAAYDAEYANRFWRVLLAANEVMAHFRTAFLGKSSPVHFFWGSFDLAVTRFSGRAAPRHPGGTTPAERSKRRRLLCMKVERGLWPGGGGPVDDAAFYSYAYPASKVCGGEGSRRRLVSEVNSVALRRPAESARSRCGTDGFPAEHLCRCG